MDKKSQAVIITGILLILVALVIVLIGWNIIRNTLERRSEDISGKSECISLKLDIIGNSSSNEIIIKRNFGSGDLSKIKILVNGGITNEGADASELDEGEEGIFDALTFFDSKDKIEIAPILKNNIQCDIADRFIVV